MIDTLSFQGVQEQPCGISFSQFLHMEAQERNDKAWSQDLPHKHNIFPPGQRLSEEWEARKRQRLFEHFDDDEEGTNSAATPFISEEQICQMEAEPETGRSKRAFSDVLDEGSASSSTSYGSVPFKRQRFAALNSFREASEETKGLDRGELEGKSERAPVFGPEPFSGSTSKPSADEHTVAAALQRGMGLYLPSSIQPSLKSGYPFINSSSALPLPPFHRDAIEDRSSSRALIVVPQPSDQQQDLSFTRPWEQGGGKLCGNTQDVEEGGERAELEYAREEQDQEQQGEAMEAFSE